MSAALAVVAAPSAALKAVCEAVRLDMEAAMARAVLKPEEAIDLLLDASDKLADASIKLIEEMENDNKIAKKVKKEAKPKAKKAKR